MLDPARLNVIASLLIVLVAARVLSDRWRFPLFPFGTYALPLTAAAMALLMLLRGDAQPLVFLFVLAALGGVLWTGASRPEGGQTPLVHGLSAAAALAVAAAAALLARHYRWWVAPLLLLLLMVTGLTVNGVVPVVRSVLGMPAREDPDEDDPTGPYEPGGVEPPRLACPSCAYSAPAPVVQQPRRVRCPRCGEGVTVRPGA